MTKEEAIKILELYRDWNIGQKSLHLINSTEDLIYNARRELILKATKVLGE